MYSNGSVSYGYEYIPTSGLQINLGGVSHLRFDYGLHVLYLRPLRRDDGLR